MPNLRVAYVLNDAAFFVSHRLPLAISVIEKGGEVIVITGTNINLVQEKQAINILKKNNITHKCCLYSQGFKNPIFEILGLFQLIFFLRSFNPSTLHSVTSKGNFMAAISLNFIKKTKLIMSVSGLGTMFTGSNNFKKNLFLSIYKLILRIFLTRVNYEIIFQNHDDFNQFQSFINIKLKSFKFISGSGVDTEYLSPSNVNHKENNILLPARMLYEKGVNEFIEAARLLKKKNIEGNFFLAGDTMSVNPSCISIETIRLWVEEGIVEYLGHQNDMKNLYRKMSVICLPSWREGFPKVLMEAASCGIPVITTDVPGCRDAIIDKKTGFLVPLKNSRVLAKKIETLIKDQKLQKMMGKAGRKLALNKFDLKIIIPQIVNLYE